jgi:hypothetical protein
MVWNFRLFSPDDTQWESKGLGNHRVKSINYTRKKVNRKSSPLIDALSIWRASSSHATGGQTRSGWNHVFIRSALISSTTYATPSVNLIHSYMYEWIFSSSLNASEDYRKIATQEAAS